MYAENRLIKIIYPGSNNRTGLTYDAFSRAVKLIEMTAGTTTSTKQHIWCGTQRCEERDGSNNVTKQFFDLGQRDGSTNYFYTKDHLGSFREMTNSAGTIQAQYSYDPFGRQTKLQGSGDADFGYAGMYSHSRSGLNLTLFRAYDPKLGRWLSRDPLEETDGTNIYSYVRNEPIGRRDSLGLATLVMIPMPGMRTRCDKSGTDKPTSKEQPVSGSKPVQLSSPGQMSPIPAPIVSIGIPWFGKPVFTPRIQIPRKSEDDGVIYPPDGGKDYYDCIRQCRDLNDEDNDKIEKCIIWCQDFWGM